ncbi:hypothetical protein NDI39_09995 [Microcoleus sp. ZQ-A2]|nr:hypothetical protein [Microcoleus sp. FACHB-1]
MGIITPGTNGTLKSNTIENMLYEASILACNWENDVTKNPTEERRVTLTEDKSAKRATLNFTFKVTREKTATGSTAFPVQTQLVNSGYVVGSGGSIVSPNIHAAIVELCEEVQRRDADVNKNSQQLNTITSLNYDSESLTVSGSASFLVDFSIDGTGNAVSRARAYLLDV